MRKRSERSEQKIVTKFFWKGLDNACIYIYMCVCVCMCVLLVYESVYIEKMLIERQFFMTLIKLRIDFLFTDLCSQHFGIELVVFVLRFFIFINMR